MNFYIISFIINIIYFCNAYEDDIDHDFSIVRPCHRSDVDCIRDYFAKHSHCIPSGVGVPEIVNRDKEIVYLPNTNMTAIVYDIDIKGLDGVVKEFYINKETGSIVIAVAFKNIYVHDKNVYYRFHRTGREPIGLKTDVKEFYPKMIITAVIPGVDNIDMSRSEIRADVSVMPTIIFRPEVIHNKNPLIAKTMKAVNHHLDVAVQERALVASPFYFLTFMKYTICDFGDDLR